MTTNNETALPFGAEPAASPTISGFGALPPPPPPPGLPPPPLPPTPVLPTQEQVIDSILSMLDPDPLARPLVLALEFPPEVLHYLKKIQRQSDETIASLTQLYLAKQPTIEGMPRIGALVEDDATAVEILSTFSPEIDTNWAGLHSRAARGRQHEANAGNPYLARWVSKTDDKKSPWLDAMGTITDTSKEKLTALCSESSPHKNARWADLLHMAPNEDKLFMSDICEAIGNNHGLFVWALGTGPDPDFRWSVAMSLLGGLGTAAVRAVFSHVPNEEDLDFWVNCDNSDMTRDILKCQQISGYPLGLLRAEWPRIQTALADEIFMYPPKALIAAMALHIIKHCRIARHGEKVYLIVAHKGCGGRYEIPAGQLDQPLMSVLNKTHCKEICFALAIPFPGPKNDTWITQTASTVLSALTPTTLCRSRPVSDKCEYIPGPSTVTQVIFERPSAVKWVNTGQAIKNVACIDLETGVVNKDFIVTGHEVIMYDWPKTSKSASAIRNWRSQLPTLVVPERGSVGIQRKVKNVNDLGEPEGYAALLDATLTADMLRDDLAGSEVGSMLPNEYPLLYVLPMGHTMEETTNQGKTNFGRILGTALVPGIGVTKMNMSTSAPTQRVLGYPLEVYGTAIFDEFQIPSDTGHFLDSSGIQSLCTGCSSTAGKAGENQTELLLRHPLILVSKVAIAPEDIVNRSIPTFMDRLTTLTRAVGKDLNELMTSTAGTNVRLSHLMWMKKNDIANKIRALETKSAETFRFNGHYTIARMFGDPASIDRYLMKARDQMRKQYGEAERSGLVDQVGQNIRFDPKFYFTSCCEQTLEMLAMTSVGDKLGQLSSDAALRQLIMDGNNRRMDAVLTQFRIKEFTANQNFINALGKTGWTRPGWKITYTPKDKSKIKKGNSPVAYIVVERHEEKDNDGNTASGPN